MEKIKIIKKEELEFDLNKLKDIGSVNVFEDRVEISFIVEE